LILLYPKWINYFYNLTIIFKLNIWTIFLFISSLFSFVKGNNLLFVCKILYFTVLIQFIIIKRFQICKYLRFQKLYFWQTLNNFEITILVFIQNLKWQFRQKIKKTIFKTYKILIMLARYAPRKWAKNVPSILIKCKGMRLVPKRDFFFIDIRRLPSISGKGPFVYRSFLLSFPYEPKLTRCFVVNSCIMTYTPHHHSLYTNPRSRFWVEIDIPTLVFQLLPAGHYGAGASEELINELAQ